MLPSLANRLATMSHFVNRLKGPISSSVVHRTKLLAQAAVVSSPFARSAELPAVSYLHNSCSLSRAIHGPSSTFPASNKQFVTHAAGPDLHDDGEAGAPGASSHSSADSSSATTAPIIDSSSIPHDVEGSWEFCLGHLHDMGYFVDSGNIPKGTAIDEKRYVKKALLNTGRSRPDVLYALPADTLRSFCEVSTNTAFHSPVLLNVALVPGPFNKFIVNP